MASKIARRPPDKSGKTLLESSLLPIVAMVMLAGCGPNTGTPQVATASPSLRPLEDCVQSSDLAREVVFPSAKGEMVVGAVLGTGAVGVILAHKVNSDLCEWLPYAKRLRDMGRRVLIFDFGLDRAGDVAGAASELRREGVTKVVLVGASMGGTASLVAAAGILPPVSGVASLSGPKDFSGMDALTASKQLTVQVLFIAAENDQEPPDDFPADARAMYSACPSRHKQLVILPGSEHGSDLLAGNVATQGRAALERFIADATA